MASDSGFEYLLVFVGTTFINIYGCQLLEKVYIVEEKGQTVVIDMLWLSRKAGQALPSLVIFRTRYLTFVTFFYVVEVQ